MITCSLNPEALAPDSPEDLLSSLLLQPVMDLVCGYLPSRFGPPFNPEHVNHFWSSQSLSQVAWEPHAVSGLQFGVFHWDEPVPLSLAHSHQEKNLIGVGAVGVSRPDFLTILASLVDLKTDESLVDQFQHELITAHEELQRKYGPRES